MDAFDAAADKILGGYKVPRPAREVKVTVADDQVVFSAEVESMTSRILKQVLDNQESQVREILKAAYDAGYEDGGDNMSAWCGCSGSYGDGPNFDGFIERLLKVATPTQEDK